MSLSSRTKRQSSEYYFEPQTKKLYSDESDEYKKTIYEKTMQKLKNGARLNNNPRSIVEVSTPTKNSATHSEVKRGLRQISLNNTGQLESNNKVTNPKEYCPMLPEKCSFCERLSCFTNLNQCSKCIEYFCNNCSFSTYNRFEENYICKSCFQ